MRQKKQAWHALVACTHSSNRSEPIKFYKLIMRMRYEQNDTFIKIAWRQPGRKRKGDCKWIETGGMKPKRLYGA